MSHRILGWLALSLALAASPGTDLAAEGDKPGKAGGEERSAADLEKDLQKAMAGRQYDQASRVVYALAKTGEPRAFASIIKLALTGDNYALEKYAGAIVAGSEVAGVRELILENLSPQKNPNFKSRIILLSVAAGRADDRAFLDAVHAALGDPVKSVVFAAIAQVRKLRRQESVEPLIRELETRERKAQDRIYHDIVKALREITGQELELSIDWKNFVAGQKGLQQQPKKEGLTTLYRRPSFFSMTVESDKVLFVIDVSGSMTERDPEMEERPPPPPPPPTPDPDAGSTGTTTVVKKTPPKEKEKKAPAAGSGTPASRERMARVKAELVKVIEGLQPGTRFGILSFSHELNWLGGAKTLRPATQAAKTEAIQWVKALQANGATRTDLALTEALSLPELDTVYLLTDGAPKDERDQRLAIEPILALAKEANRFLRCRIHTISFEQIRDTRMKTFVRKLAAENDGACTMLR